MRPPKLDKTSRQAKEDEFSDELIVGSDHVGDKDNEHAESQNSRSDPASLEERVRDDPGRYERKRCQDESKPPSFLTRNRF